MSQIVRQREIIDRRSLGAELAALTQRVGDPPRAEVAAILMRALDAGRGEVRRRFDRDNSGTETARELCFLVDQIIRALDEFVMTAIYRDAKPAPGERMALVAVGGYGRGELAPYSDIDLLFLLPSKPTPHIGKMVEYLLYVLWDLRLKVGHATRTVADTITHAKDDVTIRTALLEARYLTGDEALFLELKRRFESDIIKNTAGEFLAAKLKERDDRHARLGDSRYLVEPNVKEGKGGLRDLHTLFWIAKYIYRVDDVEKLVEQKALSAEEAKRFARDQGFLLTVRCYLHFLADRAEDRLTFDRQHEVAALMGYTDHAGTSGVERFMKHYFLVAKDVGDLTRIFCALLEAEQRKPSRFSWRNWGKSRRTLAGFSVDNGRLDVADDDAFRVDKVNLIRLFQVAQEHELDIHPHALRLITRSLRLIDGAVRADPEANRLFLAMLTSKRDPETALRRLNEAGVFGRFVPDFGRVVAQMQYDMYHTYTVDEHSLMAIGILHRIEIGELASELPLATEIMPTIDSRRVLYLATLLHDIAKGRGGDHSVIGAQVAERLGPRLGLRPDETEAAAWLIRWHLLMSNTAQKLDLDDEETIRGFVAQVQSPERLKLLLVLTVADIRAVGPKVWNAWKATLLRKLFTLSLEMMSGGMVEEARAARIATAQAAVRGRLQDFSDAEFEAYRAKTYPFYWLAFEPEAQERHARLMREADRDAAPLTVKHRIDAAHAVTELVVYTADHPGLFSRLAAALALAGANVVDAKILTMSDGMALDTFLVQDREGGAFARPDKLARLSVMFMHVLRGKLKPQIELAAPVGGIPSRSRILTVVPRVLFDNTASATQTVMEVNGHDRLGLLYDLTRAITALNLQISRAKISTFGEKVVDVFYVKDLYGHKVTEEPRLRQIRERLVAVLARPPATEAATPSTPRRTRTRREAAE